MIKFDATSLRSRVARRIFVVFLVCAFLPFGGLVLVSYHQVATFFEQRNERQLRALAKLFGVDLFQKLTFLESELQIIASKVAASTEIPSEALLETIRTSPKEQWKAVSVIRSRGQQHRLFGQIESLPDFSTMDRRRLAAGKVLISVLESTQGRSARILMSVSVNPQEPEPDILIGEISDIYLWGVNDTRLLPSYVQFCVQDQTGIMLVCSNSAFESFPSALREKMRRSALGDFEWTHQGHNYLASYWTIPLQFEFQDPGWTVILKTSKEGAFASVGELQRTFILAIVATAGLSILLAIFQIRKRLVPIEKLQEGTRRIAQQDFDFQVNIRSSDEFEDLAQSVNMMASQLGQQFHALSTKAEIDRAVDSGRDGDDRANQILQHRLRDSDARAVQWVETDAQQLPPFARGDHQVAGQRRHQRPANERRAGGPRCRRQRPSLLDDAALALLPAGRLGVHRDERRTAPIRQPQHTGLRLPVDAGRRT